MKPVNNLAEQSPTTPEFEALWAGGKGASAGEIRRAERQFLNITMIGWIGASAIAIGLWLLSTISGFAAAVVVGLGAMFIAKWRSMQRWEGVARVARIAADLRWQPFRKFVRRWGQK